MGLIDASRYCGSNAAYKVVSSLVSVPDSFDTKGGVVLNSFSNNCFFRTIQLYHLLHDKLEPSRLGVLCCLVGLSSHEDILHTASVSPLSIRADMERMIHAPITYYFLSSPRERIIKSK
eukprot:scaffold140084_cov64-Attheya_sp.AAC.2